MNPSKLRFSIEESVWLKKGQEVAEVLSMALEPDIQITEENGQVCVKGALKLHGEYRPCALEDGNSLNLENGSLREQVSYRSLTQLKMNDEGIAELDHRFPVDITIPSTRVPRLDDVFVGVDSFDYELPNPTCLELTASVSISGIQDSAEKEKPADEMMNPEFDPQPMAMEPMANQDAPVMQDQSPFTEIPIPVFEARSKEDQPEELEEENREQEIFAPFQFEAKKMFEMPIAEPEPEREHVREEPAINYNRMEEEVPAPVFAEPEANADMEEEQVQEHEQEQEEAADQGLPSLKSMAYFTPAYTPPPPPMPMAPFNQQEEAQEMEMQQEEAQMDHAYSGYQASKHFNAYSEDAEVQEEVTASHASAARKEENALYLTKMLAGNEERFSKVKMYIIQRGESLDSICERYDISIHSLMRVNRINQEEISEGQIIYIPVSQSR